MSVTAKQLLDIAREWLGLNERDGSFKEIIDLYNSYNPLAVGYIVKYTDDWCDTCVSAIAIKADAVDIIGTECGCERHIAIFKEKGIWIEDGSITPIPGDIILYNWDDTTQENDGFADHIGYVESVSNGYITCIEGNRNQSVARRVIPVGWGYIRGYARPKYDESEEEDMFNPENWSDDETDAVIARIRKRQNSMKISDYAKNAGEEAVNDGLFSDGDNDGQIDDPQAFQKRQESVVLFNRFEENLVKKYGLKEQ